MEKVSKVNQNEITWLKAALKRAEMKVDSLEQQLEQKVRVESYRFDVRFI